MNYYIYRNGKKMRCGFTTGACAAAASKAAVEMLVSGEIKNETKLKLVIRAGVAEESDEIHILERSELHSVRFDVENPEIIYDGNGRHIGARCAVRKDAGDDSDITDGMLICAEVRSAGSSGSAESTGSIESTGSAESTGCVRSSGSIESAGSSVSAVSAESSGSSGSAESNESSGSAGIVDIADITDIVDISVHGEFRVSESKGLNKHDEEKNFTVIIRGGEGVGVVTRSGLDRKPGEAAINSGPRRMITEAVVEVLEKSSKCYENEGEIAERVGACENKCQKGKSNKCYEKIIEHINAVEVVISVPEGRKAAEMTFNPVLGIEGGISILGTTGMVEPMSQAALAETVMTEIRVKHAAGWRNLCIVPGNYGMKAAEMLGISEESVVKCSNFVGDAYETACVLGMESVLLIGNLGKFIKLAGGIFNTHSDNADARMDILMRCAVAAAEGMITGDEKSGNRESKGDSKEESKGGSKVDSSGESKGASKSGSNGESKGASNGYGKGGSNVNAEILFDVLRRIDRCATTDAAAVILSEAGMLERTSAIVAERIIMHIERRWRAFEKLPATEVIVTANDGSVLARYKN